MVDLSKRNKTATLLTEVNDEVDMPATQTVESGSFETILEIPIPNAQYRTWGAGRIADGVDNRRELKVDLQDNNNNPIDGTVRLQATDPNRQNDFFYDEFRLEEVRNGKNFGQGEDEGNFKNPVVKPEDHFLVLEFQPDSGSNTLSESNSDLLLPVTKWT